MKVHVSRVTHGIVYGPLRSYRPRRAECSYPRQTLLALHGIVESLTIGNVDQLTPCVKTRQTRQRLARNSLIHQSTQRRSATSTNSDIVRPCFAASCLSLRMTSNQQPKCAAGGARLQKPVAARCFRRAQNDCVCLWPRIGRGSCSCRGSSECRPLTGREHEGTWQWHWMAPTRRIVACETQDASLSFRTLRHYI